jgi:hypothetical protein
VQSWTDGLRIIALAAPGEVLVSGAIPPLVLGSWITSPVTVSPTDRSPQTDGDQEHASSGWGEAPLVRISIAGTFTAPRR